MSNINDEENQGLNTRDLELINHKRIVFIVDEAHRSTFGDMLILIKKTFPDAIFFGFTGTPIHEENQKHKNTTTDVFGDELHRYSIADGIRDENVLGFDPYKVLTYKNRDLRLAVALDKAKASSPSDALSDPKKKEVFNRFMHSVKMAGYTDESGKEVKGIEDYLPSNQYDRAEHKDKVVEDILENWTVLSKSGKFHAIFATQSIADAIEYYRKIKSAQPSLKITALFDPNIDNNGCSAYKEDGLVEIINDYNHRYNQNFDMASHGKFKKDIASRLAHKAPHESIEKDHDKQLDLLIVVDQMLTGFDSKWLNTLYLDKKMQYENIIQAFSRTNRLFGHDKPFGTIRYYRLPNTMERNINQAIKLYSGDRPIGLFVERLDFNLKAMNSVFDNIEHIFEIAGVEHFEKIPADTSERGQFAKLFKELNEYLEAAKIQGFSWEKLKYTFAQDHEDKKTDKEGEEGEEEKDEKEEKTIEIVFDKNTYLSLALRYKELFSESSSEGGVNTQVPYEIDGYLCEIDTGKIDSDYMNSRFDKYLKTLNNKEISKQDIQKTLNELHKSFSSLSQEEQKYANLFLHDIQSGMVKLDSNKTFRDYISEYLFNAKNDQIHRVSEVLGLEEAMLRAMMGIGITDASINEYGRFDELKNTVDKSKARAYFQEIEGNRIPPFKVNIKIDEMLQKFVVEEGFEIQ